MRFSVLLSILMVTLAAHGRTVFNTETRSIDVVDEVSPPTCDVEQLSYGIKVTYSFLNYELDTIIQNGQPRISLSIPDFGNISNPGELAVPIRRDFIDIGDNTSINIELLPCKYISQKMDLATAPELGYEGELLLTSYVPDINSHGFFPVLPLNKVLFNHIIIPIF